MRLASLSSQGKLWTALSDATSFRQERAGPNSGLSRTVDARACQLDGEESWK